MTLVRHLSDSLDVEVVLAPASLDACVALCRATAPRLLLDTTPSLVREATLAAACARTQTTVLSGSPEDLGAFGVAMARAVGPGRLVRAREWKLDPGLATYGRRGAADTTPPESGTMLAEHPLAPSASVRAALMQSIDALALERYPPPSADALQAAIARHHSVDARHVVVSGGGPIGLLSLALRALADPGDEVQAFVPTFGQLAHLCAQHGLALKLSTRRQVSASARIVYVVSPMGADPNAMEPPELETLRRALPPDRVLIVDRAYAPLDAPDPLVLRAPGPVLVLRTLSKAGALAGLRVGWGVSTPPVASLLRRFSLPYDVSTLVSDAAIAALEDTAHRARTAQSLVALRVQTVRALAALGFEVLATNGHLLHVRAPAHLRAALDEDDALPFHPFDDEGTYTVGLLPDHVVAALERLNQDRT